MVQNCKNNQKQGKKRFALKNVKTVKENPFKWSKMVKTIRRKKEKKTVKNSKKKTTSKPVLNGKKRDKIVTNGIKKRAQNWF